MTSQELLSLLMQGGAGLAGGLAQGQQNKNQQAQNQQQMMDQKVQQMMAALQNAQQTGQNLQMNRQQMPQTQASLSPLGAEQTFLQRQRLMATMLPEMANFRAAGPTDPGVRGAYTPNTNMLKGLNNPKLLEAYGDQATATSLADRRKLMAQINPEYQFSGLENFGLDPSFNQGVEESRMTAGANLKAYEAAQTSLANQQTSLANQNMQAALTQPPAEKKSGGIMSKVGSVLKVAAPIAALAIPGVGPMAAAAIAGGGTALGNKMQGNSWTSSLVQGGLAGAGGAMAKSSMQGNGLNPFNNGSGSTLNNAMTSASLPSTFMGNGMPQGPTQVNLPSSNVGGYSPFPQGVSQKAPGIPGNRMANVLMPKTQAQQGQLTPQQIADMIASNGSSKDWSQPNRQAPINLPQSTTNTQFKVPMPQQVPAVQGPPQPQSNVAEIMKQMLIAGGTMPAGEWPENIPHPFIGSALRPAVNRRNNRQFNNQQPMVPPINVAPYKGR